MALRPAILAPLRYCCSPKSFTRSFSNSANPLLASPNSATGDMLATLTRNDSQSRANARRKAESTSTTTTAAPAADERERQQHMSEALRNITNQRQQRSSTVASSAERLKKEARKRDLQIMSTRNWKGGDVYAPHDLSLVEIKRWKGMTRPEIDVFDELAMDPVAQWKNYSMMSEFSTSMGRIKSQKETGLRNVNQRKIAKAIRRAVGMGFLPSVHMHPEMLRRY